MDFYNVIFKYINVITQGKRFENNGYRLYLKTAIIKEYDICRLLSYASVFIIWYEDAHQNLRRYCNPYLEDTVF